MCQDKGTTVPSPGELLEWLIGGIDDSPDNLQLPPMRPPVTFGFDPLDLAPYIAMVKAEVERDMSPLEPELDGPCPFCCFYVCVCEDSYGAYDDGGPWAPLDDPVEDLDALEQAALEEWPWPEEAGPSVGIVFCEDPRVALADKLCARLPQRNRWADTWEEQT
jgi:hypothetical protein